MRRYLARMATTKRRAKTAEPPQEEPGALYIRGVPPHVMLALEQWATAWSDERGTKVTRADVVRELLHRAVKRAAKGETP